jgi:hypothetical protein
MVTTQVGKGTQAQSCFAYLPLNFFLCAAVPLPHCACLSSYSLLILPLMLLQIQDVRATTIVSTTMI